MLPVPVVSVAFTVTAVFAFTLMVVSGKAKAPTDARFAEVRPIGKNKIVCEAEFSSVYVQEIWRTSSVTAVIFA